MNTDHQTTPEAYIVKKKFPWKIVFVVVLVLASLIFLSAKNLTQQSREPKEVFTMTKLATAVCSNEAPVTNAPAYKAGELKGFRIFEKDGFSGSYTTDIRLATLRVPDELNETLSVYHKTKSVNQTELVGCIDHEKIKDTGRTCPFKQATAKIYASEHILKIYSTKTHTLLKKVVVPAERDYQCPTTVLYYERKGAKVYEPADMEAVIKEFAQF